MKSKKLIMTAAMTLVLGGGLMLNAGESRAAKKQNVKAVVKGSTLTISGRGEMPSSLKVKKSKRNRIRKIVVRKGITSIPVNAFSQYENVTSATVAASVKVIGAGAFRCEKLKKLTVPGDFKTKMNMSSNGAYWVAGKVDTVIFNTDLNIERAAVFDTNNLVVSKEDSKYKSIDGIVYSKDGKEIVRVPFQRGTVQIADGCEVFCLQSVMYANQDTEEQPSGGCRVRRIVVPASVRRVDSQSYFALNDEGLSKRVSGDEVAGLQAEIRTEQLDGQSFSELVHVLRMGIDDLMKQYPERIVLSGDMYIADSHMLLKYKGKDHEVTVPEGITKIGDYAFCDNGNMSKLVLPEGLTEIGKKSFHRALLYMLWDDLDPAGQSGEKVVFPSTLKKIGEEAFSENYMLRNVKLPASLEICGKGAFRSSGVQELVLPDAMKVIPEQMAENNNLNKIVLPDGVEIIEQRAFISNMLVEIQFGKNVKEIGAYAFSHNHWIRRLTIPETVIKIGEYAFWDIGDTGVSIVIEGTSKGFADEIFDADATLVYARGPKEQRTTFERYGKKRVGKKRLELDLGWVTVNEAEGYELVAAANAGFTKNRKKVTVKGSRNQKTLSIRGKFSKNTKIYVKIRPYSYMDGKKIYGRWSKTICGKGYGNI